MPSLLHPRYLAKSYLFFFQYISDHPKPIFNAFLHVPSFNSDMESPFLLRSFLQRNVLNSLLLTFKNLCYTTNDSNVRDRPHSCCPNCDMFFPWAALNRCHSNTILCARGVEQKNQHLTGGYMRGVWDCIKAIQSAPGNSDLLPLPGMHYDGDK